MKDTEFLSGIRQKTLSGGYFLYGEEEYRIHDALKRAKGMLEETDCNAVMIGRAALGNPWLIRDCVNYLEDGTLPKEVAIEERMEMLKRHINLLVENRGEDFAIPKMRSQAAYYVKKLPRTIELKQQIFKMNTKEDLFNLLDNYVESLEK